MTPTLDKRDRVAAYAGRCGFNRLVSHLPKRNLLLVLNYHRIGDWTRSPYDPGAFSATDEELDRQIRFLKLHTNCVTLDDVIALAEQRTVPRDPWTLVTFDDGYRDNYQRAFPILRSHGVQGVFFLPTSLIGTRTLPWWDRLAYMINTCGKPKLTLNYPYQQEFDCKGGRLRDALMRILRLYKMPGVEPGPLMEALEEACGVAPPLEHRERCFMSWNELNEMAAAGMALGAHSHRHQIMSNLNSDAQFQEAIESKRSIEQHTGVAVKAFAYPDGTRASFSTDTIAALKRAGYRAAFSFYGGVNRRPGIEPFDIRRCGVDGQIFARFECQVLVTTVAARFWP